MKMIASIALALSLAATASFAHDVPLVPNSVTIPGGSIAAGQTVVIAGTTYTWTLIGGVLFLLLVASASDSTT